MRSDAQGFDTGLFASLVGTGLMERVMVVEMETVKDGCPPLYASTGHSPFCSHMVRQMAQYGYSVDTPCHKKRFTGNKGCEAELIFRRK